jgi:quercetin dioxygenase-like cupin family protein
VRVLRSKKWLVLGVLGVSAAVGVGVAFATLTQNVLTDTNSVRLRIVRSEFVPSADQPTFDSLWHTHPGPVIVQVTEGRLRIVQGSCHARSVSAGQTFIEVPEVPVDAVATRAVKWTTSMILPVGPAPATFVSNPCPEGIDNDGGWHGR